MLKTEVCNYCKMNDEFDNRRQGEEIHLNGGRRMHDTIPHDKILEYMTMKEVYAEIEHNVSENLYQLRVWNMEDLAGSNDVDINYCPFCGRKL